MDNLQKPQSQETKDFLEKECGLRPYTPTREPNYANPDRMECKSHQNNSVLTLCRNQTTFSVPPLLEFRTLVESKPERWVFQLFRSPSPSCWFLPSITFLFTIKKRDSTSRLANASHLSRTLSSIQLRDVLGTGQLQSTRVRPKLSDRHSCCFPWLHKNWKTYLKRLLCNSSITH